MALVNIGEGNRDDGFYRYKMPKMVTKIEGRGNGIKTNLVNLVDVSKALARPPSYTTKFFGCLLGAQSKYDEKTATSTVNGAHETGKLVQLLEQFIKKYVQCYGCGNPETEIQITKTQCIVLKCAACGFMSDVDMRDKLTTFILNNPPEVKKSKGNKQMRRAEKDRLKAGEAADEAKKSAKGSKKKGEESVKKSKKKTGDDGNGKENDEASPETSQTGDGEDDDDDVEWQTDTSAEAARARIAEQLSAATSGMVMLNVEEDVKKSRKEKELESPSTPQRNGNGSHGKEGEEEEDGDGEGEEEGEEGEGEGEGEGEEGTGGEKEEGKGDSEKVKAEEIRYEKLVQDLKDFIGTHNQAEIGAHVSKLYKKSEEKGEGEGAAAQELLNAVFETLFQGVGKGLSKEVAKKKVLLSKILPDETAQSRFLGAVEIYIGVKNVDACKEIPLVLKILYDDDIVEEEQLTEWFDRKGISSQLKIDDNAASTIRKAAAPFITWLREAEAESEEEE